MKYVNILGTRWRIHSCSTKLDRRLKIRLVNQIYHLKNIKINIERRVHNYIYISPQTLTSVIRQVFFSKGKC